ncbi:polymerase [Tsuneonella deserti]|uniref:Polymerase n=1 Tax=Tsuneonella deserti TaxID=2035528 RepID=A0ABQ1SCX7_9SPHN|nr:O-antigen ligase family protein [Tsuneonella deserti]GGE03280.1 polymerase [Tsuneonella deserti]
MLIGFLVATFLLGGGSRYDILSLPLLRIIAVAGVAYALYFSPPGTLRQYWLPIAIFLAFTVWIAVQLIPLPPGMWTALQGRELLVATADAVGVPQPWRPISVIPWRTTNALLSLWVPWAAILLAARVQLEENRLLTGALIGIGLTSATLGMLQMLGPEGNILYFYRVTNPESAVGLFSNRNHNAAFLACCIPIVGLWITRSAIEGDYGDLSPRGSRYTSSVGAKIGLGAGIIFFLALGILSTGSRAGLLAAIVAVASTLAALASNFRGRLWKRHPRMLYLFAFGALSGLLILIAFFSQNESVERLGDLDQSEELRLQIWRPIADLVPQYGWSGAGIGTFVEVYQVVEPDRLLGPKFVNHAHNDWLELAVCGGIPALAIVAAALAALGRCAWRAVALPAAEQADRPLALGAASILVILALFSIADYPLRTPSIAAFSALSALCLFAGSRKRRPSG